MDKNRTYIAIDLKSFFASVECVLRGLNPLTTNLVVADNSRTEKTICLAVTPALKAYGIPGRARLFEVVQKVKQINNLRRAKAPNRSFSNKSYLDPDLKAFPDLELDYIVAPPQMAKYMEYSTRIYNIYLKYIAPEDMHVYSIDEVFMDVTCYLQTYKMTARELAMHIIQDVLQTTGITATAGIGPNMYLCKIALDIGAKHIKPDKDGVRIAELDEMTYRQMLWSHRPITDFWRVGKGYAKKLEKHGMYTMGDVARCSIGKANDYHNEDLLYRLFGINAELLIDHAWGYEPCTIADIKGYRSSSHSLGSGQVLQHPYEYSKAEIVVSEMADQLALSLMAKGVVADQLVLTIGYDIDNLMDPIRAAKYTGPITMDPYGRAIPKHSHGTINMGSYCCSSNKFVESARELFQRIANPDLLIRRLNLVANHVIYRSEIPVCTMGEQLDLFSLCSETPQTNEREERMQQAVLSIKEKYGKNAILRGLSLEEGATQKDRNQQIGGHKA